MQREGRKHMKWKTTQNTGKKNTQTIVKWAKERKSHFLKRSTWLIDIQKGA